MSSPPQPRDAIALNGVVKTFDTGVKAVGGVSLKAKPGEFVSIVGPSGCGKSTILRLVAGLADLTDGTLSLNGSQVTGPRQDVGMMFQRPTLLPWKSALENALLPAMIKGREKGDEQRARELLELVGLRGFEHTYPRHLSGGMQQRVALARLLMIGAGVLLLDEPFAAVDELTRDRLNVELLKVHEHTGATIVLVTHNLNEAVLLADRVIVMSPRPGRISEEIPVPFPRPRDPRLVTTSEFQSIVYQARERLDADGAMAEEGAA